MPAKLISPLVLLPWLLTGAGLSGCIASNSSEASQAPKSEAVVVAKADPDQRIIVSLSPEQRVKVLGDMNQFLLSTQEIVDGIATDDAELIQSAVLDGLGQQTAKGGEPDIMAGAFPPEFKQLGSAMKKQLKLIGELSKEDVEDAVLLDQLSNTLMYCQSCHVSYQFRITETP